MDLLELIQQAGFPIAIAAYVVMRLEPKIDRLIENQVQISAVLLHGLTPPVAPLAQPHHPPLTKDN
jgi:hypothetical protein